MSTSLVVKLRTQAAANPSLAALLTSGGVFCWFGPQAPPGASQPLVEVMEISQVPQYGTALLPTLCLYRVQFTIWDTSLEGAKAVKNAIINFLTTFSAFAPPGSPSLLRPNRVVNARIGKSQAQTAPITYWVSVDAMIWNNELS
jgi:hypothetical protein